MTTSGVLERLGDVIGVIGSFVSNEEGDLLLGSMPSDYGEPELRRTTSRLASIVRCATLCGLEAETLDLNVGPCRLFALRFQGGTLCVLVEPNASRRAVRMAMQLAVSELPAMMGRIDQSGAVADRDDEATTRYSPAGHERSAP